LLDETTIDIKKYLDVLITGTNKNDGEKVVFDFHSVSEDYFPQPVSNEKKNSNADVSNYRCRTAFQK